MIPPELDQHSDGFGRAEAVYRQLTPVQQGNLAFTDRELAAAIYFTAR